MMFAVRKLQGIGLIMLLTMCTLVAYPISLRVAATRAELQQIEREIAETRQHNRMLEGDIAVLANVHQLDRWNTEFFGYAPPSAAQYLPGERALANLDSMQPVRSGAETLIRSYDWYCAEGSSRPEGIAHRSRWREQALGALRRIS